MTCDPIKRLDFRLPDFTRVTWVSEKANEVWSPRIGRISVAWDALERASVRDKIRECALLFVSPDSLIDLTAWCVKGGLCAVVLSKHKAKTSGYSTTAEDARAWEPFIFRVVVGTPKATADFQEAWHKNENQRIGRLLGYPDCCVKFFESTWIDGGLIDTTWPMACNSVSITGRANSIIVSGPPEANILLRWMGIRSVFHLPCSFSCERTAELGRKLLLAGRDAGFASEMDWLNEMLSWPVEWSALHGIAEVKMPIAKVSTRTDATAEKLVVQRTSNSYAEFGAKGVAFPYKNSRQRLTKSNSFKAGLSVTTGQRFEDTDWYFKDNGFSSKSAMVDAHKQILSLVTSIYEPRGPVLDLGCGNGLLLKSLIALADGAVPYGIELDGGKLDHARYLMPKFASNFKQGDIFDLKCWPPIEEFQLVMLMPGRLKEVNNRQSNILKRRIANSSSYLLVYCYGDIAERYGGLANLAKTVGIELVDPHAVTASFARITRQ